MHRSQLGALIGRLRGGGLEPTAEDLADALWLAQWLPQGRRRSATGPGEAPPDPLSTSLAEPEDDRDRAGDDTGSAPEQTVDEPHRSPALDPTPAPGSVPLHAERGGTAPRPGDGGTAAATPAFPVRAPAATALPGLLRLQQSLRPLRRYAALQDRPGEGPLDEEATAERSAMTGFITPVRRPARDQRADVQLLMDAGLTMAVWERMVEELRQACQQSGVFRDVQVHQLYDAGEGAVPLIGTTSGPTERTRLRSADQFHDPTGRRLTLLVSDCVGPLWQRGGAQRLLHSWPRGCPIAVVQPLPPRLWERTALPAEPGLLTRTPEPGGHTVFVPDHEPWRPRARGARPVPVLQPTPEAFAVWARLLSDTGGRGERAWAAWAMPLEAPAAARAPVQRSPEDLLRAFRASASPGAVRLAVYLAAAPLTLPVMQLVQRAMLPDTGPMELAEVLLGGVLRQLPGTEARPCFSYPRRVQEILLNSLDQDTAGLVLKHCSAYVERHFGKGTRNFAAFAAARLAGHDPESGGMPGAPVGEDGGAEPVEGGAEAELFAQIPARVLRFYIPDLVAATPLAEAERLLALWHSQADPSLLTRAQEQAETALQDSGLAEQQDSGVRALITLGRILRAEAGTAAVRGTERRTELLRRAATLLDTAHSTAAPGAERAAAALELAAVQDALWQHTRDVQHLETALAALPAEAADWPEESLRALRLRRGRLLLAQGRAAAAVAELRAGQALLDAEGAPEAVRCAALLDLAEALRASGAELAETVEVLNLAELAARDDPALRLRTLTARAALYDGAYDGASADRAYEAAVGLAPPEGEQRGRLLTTWGESLLRRAARPDGAAVVDRAERVLREALTALPARSADRGRVQGLVGSALAQRFRHLGFLPDLFESRHLLRQVVRGAQAQVRAEGWLQLGRVRLELWRHAGAPVLSDALQAYRDAEHEAGQAYGERPGSATGARAAHGQGAVLALMGRPGAAAEVYGAAAARWRRLFGELREVDWQEVELTRHAVAELPDALVARAGAGQLSDEEWNSVAPPWYPWGGAVA